MLFSHRDGVEKCTCYPAIQSEQNNFHSLQPQTWNRIIHRFSNHRDGIDYFPMLFSHIDGIDQLLTYVLSAIKEEFFLQFLLFLYNFLFFYFTKILEKNIHINQSHFISVHHFCPALHLLMLVLFFVKYTHSIVYKGREGL